MKATFNGVNASGYTNCWGYHFPCGEPVEIEGEAIEEARRHPEFSLSEDKGTFDHDGDGKAGGSKPKAVRKPRKAKK